MIYRTTATGIRGHNRSFLSILSPRFKCKPIVVLLCLSAFSVAGSPSDEHFAAPFKKAMIYWLDLESEGAIEARSIACLIAPMMSKEGIQYLNGKTTSTNTQEVQVAVVSLIAIYEVLAEQALVGQDQYLIDYATMYKLASLYSTNGMNRAVRSVLKAFIGGSVWTPP